MATKGTNKTKVVKLPRKMSALLRLAVKDAQACERSKKYSLHMNTWHDGTHVNGKRIREQCEVCMAGAVMAKTLKCDPRSQVSPDDFRLETSGALHAVNHMREAQFRAAAGELRIRVTNEIERVLRVAEMMIGFEYDHAPGFARD